MAALLRKDDKLGALVHQLSNAVGLYARTEGTEDSTLVDSLHSFAELYCDHIWKRITFAADSGQYPLRH